ncbi:MAG: hypothetical protein ACRDG9_09065 [Actinomycetota bacterium]
MRKPFRTIALSTLVVTALSAMSNTEAWSFETQMRSPGGDYRGYGGRPPPGGSGGGFSFGYGTGGFNSCSQPYGGFYAECLYGGSNYVPPPTYRYSPYAPGFYNGYEDGYYRGYYDGNRSRYGRRHQKFRSR